MRKGKPTLRLSILCIVLFVAYTPLLAQEVNSDSITSPILSNAIYGSFGVSLETIGETWFTGTLYYERMFQKKTQNSKVNTFIKAGYGGALYWKGSSSYVLGQYGILTGLNKHHLEVSAGLVQSLDTAFDLMPLSGSFGYRIQKPGGHFIFRTGIGWPEALYLGLGASF